jgi:hypothetical protein
MKKGLIFATTLAMALGVGVAVGAHQGKVAEVKAEEAPNTWMFRAQLNLAECSPHYAECVFPEDKPVVGAKFHYWGTNVDVTVDASYMVFKTFDYYGVNVSLRDDQTITGAQWIIDQKDEGYKYSVDTHKFGSDDVTVLDKSAAEDFYIIEWQYKHEWEKYGDVWKWKLLSESGDTASTFKLDINAADPKVPLEKDPVNNCLKVTNFTVENGEWIGFVNNGSVQYASSTKGMLDEASKNLVHGGADNWYYVNEGGEYDVFIYSDCISLRLYGIEEVSIYYVTDSADATVDYIYTWGGAGQFGAFPGTPITDVVGVKELTGNGVLHFQGGETAKLIYSIPVTIGYPSGDTMFMFNNGTAEYKSDERALVGEAAYWWTGPANIEAGDAIEFLVYAETRRNEVADTSVCNVNKVNAKAIVDLYNAFDDDIAATYIDCTTVYTWKDASKTENTLVSYKKVVEEYGRIAEVAVDGSSLYFDGLNYSINNNAVIIIIAVASTSVLAFTILLVFKKKKQK